DHDTGRPHHPVTEPVALLHDLEHGTLLRLGRLGEQRLVDVRVEAAVRLDLGEALALESRLQLLMDQTNALLELCLFVRLGGGKRPLEVVERRQQLLDQPLMGARDQALLVTRGPLAVVVEVGRDPLEVVQVLVPLCLERGEPLLELGLGRCRHEVLASSSTTSASSITSSSDSDASPLPEDACACCAEACA